MGETDPHQRKRPGSPTVYCHSLDCDHKYAWQCKTCHDCPEARCQLRKGHRGPHGAETGMGEYSEWVSDAEAIFPT